MEFLGAFTLHDIGTASGYVCRSCSDSCIIVRWMNFLDLSLHLALEARCVGLKIWRLVTNGGEL